MYFCEREINIFYHLISFRRSDSKRKYINVNKELNRNLSWPCLTENGISPNDENRERRSTEENSPIQIDSQIIFDENEAFQKFSTDATVSFF